MKSIGKFLTLLILNFFMINHTYATPVQWQNINFDELEVKDFLELVEFIESPEKANEAIESYCKSNFERLIFSELKLLFNGLKNVHQNRTKATHSPTQTKNRMLRFFVENNAKTMGVETMKLLIQECQFALTTNLMIELYLNENIENISWQDQVYFLNSLRETNEYPRSYTNHQLNSNYRISQTLFSHYAEKNDIDRVIEISKLVIDELAGNRWIQEYYYSNKNELNTNLVKKLVLALREVTNDSRMDYGKKNTTSRIILDWANTEK